MDDDPVQNFIDNWTVAEVNENIRRERIAGNRIGCLIACLSLATFALLAGALVYLIVKGN